MEHRGVLPAYLELTKPKVVFLNLFVGLVSFLLAASHPPPVHLCTFLAAGYLVAGGCGAINCWYDRDIDRVMARTSGRVIPRNALSPRRVLLFGSLLLTTGLLAAVLILPFLAAAMMAAGAGMQFGQDGRSTLGVRLQHLSNLGIKTPNPGINFVQVYYAYRF